MENLNQLFEEVLELSSDELEFQRLNRREPNDYINTPKEVREYDYAYDVFYGALLEPFKSILERSRHGRNKKVIFTALEAVVKKIKIEFSIT